MGLDHGPPNFCQKVWFLIMGTMVIIPIWVLIMYPYPPVPPVVAGHAQVASKIRMLPF